MARRILIIDRSASMRRIIRTMILAEINDAEIGEATDVSEAMDRLGQQKFHLALFSRESADHAWREFMQKRHAAPDNPCSFVLFTSSKHEGVLEEFQPYGVQEHIRIPCTPHELGNVINRVCSIFSLRTGRRYSLPDTSATLEQGAVSIPAEVINFSDGGLMCELGRVESYSWNAPTMVTIHFPLEDGKLRAIGLYSSTTRLTVAETYSDFTPKRVRVAFRFITVPPEAKAVLEKVFAHIERQEGMFARD